MRIHLLALLVLNATFFLGSHAQTEAILPIVVEIVPTSPIKFRVGQSEFTDVELHQFLGFLGTTAERFGDKGMVVVKLASSEQLYDGMFAASVATKSYEKVYIALPASLNSQDDSFNILRFIPHDETTSIQAHLKARPAGLIFPDLIDPDPNGGVRRQLEEFDRIRQGLVR